MTDEKETQEKPLEEEETPLEAEETPLEEEEKPLDKMTATELREVAKGIPGITGASGMKKDELLSAIKKARGIEEEVVTKRDGAVKELKSAIKELKKKRAEALESGDSKNAKIYKRRISRLKKRTRRSA